MEDIPDYENYDYTREWANKKIEDLAEKRILSSWIRSSDTCLELGGGYGRITSFLEGYFDKVVMVDFSKANIRRAKQRTRKADIVRGEINRIPCKNDSFDYIFMIRVVHHLPDPLAVLNEMRRVAKDQATIVISAPNPGLGKLRHLKSNTLVGRGEYGHKIYAAPLQYYSSSASESLIEETRLGTGMFENFIGLSLSRLKFLHLVDVATSPIWRLKPNVFMRYTVSKQSRAKNF